MIIKWNLYFCCEVGRPSQSISVLKNTSGSGAIAQGHKFVLSTKVTDINKATGYFKKELQYLASKGYKLAKDGLSMTKN